MAEAVAHRGELADRSIELLRLVRQHLPIDARPSVWREHPRDLIEREAGRAAERDEG
jgi:hypothetical protein